MLFFKKKKEIEPGQAIPGEEEEEEEKPEETPAAASGDVSIGKMSAELEKLKAQFSTFYELQKASTERFSRINETIGELRTMLIERDKSGQRLEAKATQAVDLVSTVKPDKLMIELKKGDGKIEALRANLESNETIMNNIMGEMREIRNKMGVYKGMEQVIKMNEEVKAEIMEIRKVNATIQRHADKVETIFSEMQKRFSDFEKFKSTVADLDKASKQMASDVDSLKVKVSDLASKKEVENLVNRFDTFEKHASNVISLLNGKFNEMKKEFYDDYNKKMERTDKLLNGFDILAKKTPDLDKYFNLLDEEAKKAAKKPEPEKVKEPGSTEDDDKKETTPEEKEGMLSKLKQKLTAKKGGGEKK